MLPPRWSSGPGEVSKAVLAEGRAKRSQAIASIIAGRRMLARLRAACAVDGQSTARSSRFVDDVYADRPVPGGRAESRHANTAWCQGVVLAVAQQGELVRRQVRARGLSARKNPCADEAATSLLSAPVSSSCSRLTSAISHGVIIGALFRSRCRSWTGSRTTPKIFPRVFLYRPVRASHRAGPFLFRCRL